MGKGLSIQHYPFKAHHAACGVVKALRLLRMIE